MSGRFSSEGFEKNFKLVKKYGEIHGLEMKDAVKSETGVMDWERILGLLRVLSNHLATAYAEIDVMKNPPVKTTTETILNR